MANFKEANQIRLDLKMKFSNFWWYSSSSCLLSKDDGYLIVIKVKKLDNFIIKQISPVINNISIKTELE